MTQKVQCSQNLVNRPSSRVASMLCVCLMMMHFIAVKPLNAHVVIASNSIPNLLDDVTLNGPYNKLLDRLNQLTDEKMDIVFYPPQRAGIEFDSRKVDCLFPANLEKMTNVGPLITSKPVNWVSAYLFAKQPFDINQLLPPSSIPVRIAYRRGNTFGGTLSKLSHHQLYEVNLDEQSFGMLDKDRVDYVVGYLSDVRELLKRPDGTQLYYHKNTELYIHSENLVCHDDKKNRAFIKQVNQATADLYSKGELKAILGVEYNRQP